jgi:hypothetical protein
MLAARDSFLSRTDFDGAGSATAAPYDPGVDTATILIDMVRKRPIAFDLTNRAVGVTVLAVTDFCVVEKGGWDVQG